MQQQEGNGVRGNIIRGAGLDQRKHVLVSQKLPNNGLPLRVLLCGESDHQLGKVVDSIEADCPRDRVWDIRVLRAAEFGLPSGQGCHRRQVCARRAAADIDVFWVNVELIGVQPQKTDGRADILNLGGEAVVGGGSVPDAGYCEAVFSEEGQFREVAVRRGDPPASSSDVDQEGKPFAADGRDQMQLERERHGAGCPRLCIGNPAVHPRVIADLGNRSLLNHGMSFPLSLDGEPQPPGAATGRQPSGREPPQRKRP